MKNDLLVLGMLSILLFVSGCSHTGTTFRYSGGGELLANVVSDITGLDIGPNSTSVVIGNSKPLYDEIVILGRDYRVPPGWSISDSWRTAPYPPLPVVVRSYSDPDYQNLVAVGYRTLQISSGMSTVWEVSMKDVIFLDGSYRSSYYNGSPYPQPDMGQNVKVDIPAMNWSSVSVTETINCTNFDLVITRAASERVFAVPYVIEMSKQGGAKTDIVKPGGVYRTITGPAGQPYRGNISLRISVVDRGRVRGYVDNVSYPVQYGGFGGEAPNVQQKMITIQDVRSY